jgi:PAS domain S-box-containing protein
VRGIVSNSRDITDKKSTEDQLRTLGLLAKQTLSPVIVTDPGRKITWVNDAFIRTYKYSSEEALGRDPQELLSGPETSEEKLERLKKMILSKEAFTDEIKYYTKDGRKKIVAFQVQPLYDERGSTTGFFSMHHDITEKRKLEKKLAKEQKEKERRVAEAVIVTQEKERSEIASELHDNVNQILTTVKLYLEVVQTDREANPNLIQKSIQLILDAIQEIRGISHTLSYVSTRDITLQEALTELVETINLAGKIKVVLDVDLQEQTIDEKIKLSIYRIVQEQTNNIIKYADASCARIEISQCGENLALTIADNGVGFEPCRKKSGIGFSNIETRVLACSGKMEVKSSPGNGCCLIIHFPLA